MMGLHLRKIINHFRPTPHKKEILPEILVNFPGWQTHYTALTAVFEQYIELGYISKSEIAQSLCMDFGGSHGQLAYWLLTKGASGATVIDLSIPGQLFKELQKYNEKFDFSSESIENFSKINSERYDSVYAFTVTEHICNMPSVLSAIYNLLRPGGTFFFVHDNYFHPSGAHDNSILQCGKNGIYEYKGIKCWESKVKCKATEEMRLHMSNMPFPLWGKVSEGTCNPENCTNCNFYKRTHPWAHIIYRNEFKKVFPEIGFNFTNLNKINPFQLKQHILEAGFTIDLWKRTYVQNQLPDELLDIGISRKDMMTVNIIGKAIK